MRLARIILRLYPEAWRARYEDELLDIAASEGVSLRLLLDLLGGALDARLHPEVVAPRGHRGPVVYDERELLRSRYRGRRQFSPMGVLSWLGWTVLGGNLIGALYLFLWLFDLSTKPAQGTDAYDTLVWVQLLGAPLIGNLLVRRVVRAARDWASARTAG